MPVYHYQALDSSGKKSSGFVEALNEKEAKGLLREQGSMVTKIGVKSQLSSKQNLSGPTLLAFTTQLGLLLSAGVPLYESLVTIEEQARGEKYHRVILSLSEQIKGGASLSHAMSSYPDSFDKLYRSMIAAGESVGGLDVVLEKLGQLLARQNKLRRQISTALIYPCILGSFSLLIICLLLGFVVPSIEGIFEGRELNSFTTLVMGVSHIFRDYWWLYIPVTGGTLTYLVMQARSPAGRLWMERNFLKVPIIRTLVIQTAVARFCRTMGTLQQGGLTMIDAMRLSREVMRNVVIEDEMKRAETKIIEGSSLSAEMMRSKWIPHIVPRMLAVGEESGGTIVMLNKIADMYEDEIEKNLDRVMALAQPVILIFMGTVIGFVLLAILLPLTDVSSFGM